MTPRVTTFPCPGCQHDIDLGERGISMLFRNFTLESIVERYRQAARAATAIVCNMCKPPAQQEATKSCMDCKASYCNECFKLHHPWGTPKAQHEYVGPTTNFRPKVDGDRGKGGVVAGGEGGEGGDRVKGGAKGADHVVYLLKVVALDIILSSTLFY